MNIRIYCADVGYKTAEYSYRSDCYVIIISKVLYLSTGLFADATRERAHLLQPLLILPGNIVLLHTRRYLATHLSGIDNETAKTMKFLQNFLPNAQKQNRPALGELTDNH